MEERIPPPTPNDINNSSNNNNDDDHHQSWPPSELVPPPPTHGNIREGDNSGVVALQVKPASQGSRTGPRETYIVQMPKEIIYRVPPPENARLVEQYRNPIDSRRRCGRCTICIISVLLTVALLVTIAGTVAHFTLSPNPPSFSIKHLTIKNPHPNQHQHRHPVQKTGYRVELEVSNPNQVNGIQLEEGTTSFWYKGKEIGKGKSPETEVDEGKTTKMEVALTAEKAATAAAEHKGPVKVKLNVKVPAKMMTWLMTKRVDLTVKCEMELSTLKENAKVKSQKCYTETR